MAGLRRTTRAVGLLGSALFVTVLGLVVVLGSPAAAVDAPTPTPAQSPHGSGAAGPATATDAGASSSPGLLLTSLRPVTSAPPSPTATGSPAAVTQTSKHPDHYRDLFIRITAIAGAGLVVGVVGLVLTRRPRPVPASEAGEQEAEPAEPTPEPEPKPAGEGGQDEAPVGRLKTST